MPRKSKYVKAITEKDISVFNFLRKQYRGTLDELHDLVKISEERLSKLCNSGYLSIKNINNINHYVLCDKALTVKSKNLKTINTNIITEYNCSFEDLPDNLETKTGLKRLGFVPVDKPIAKVIRPDKDYDLYNVFDIFNVKSILEKEYDWFEIEQDWNLNKDKYVIVHSETTGVMYDDEIIKLSIIDLNGDILYNQYFKPFKDSSRKQYKTHKISKYFLSDKPTWVDCWNDIRNTLKDKTILVHNESFEKRLIEQTCLRYHIKMDFNLNIICTMKYIEYRYGVRQLDEVIKILKKDSELKQIHNSLVNCFKCLYIINPNADVFNVRKIANDYFDKLCNYKILNGDKNGKNKGLNWLKREFKLIDIPTDFNYFGLRTCKDIINKLQPSIDELNKIKRSL